MKTINQTLHDYWFEPAPAARLAMLRILVGAFAVWYLLIMEYDTLLRVARSTDPTLFAPVGIVFGSPVPPDVFAWILRGTIVAGVMFTLGLWHRIVGPLYAVGLTWVLCYQDSWSMIFHSMNLLVLHTVVLGFTRSADALSLDSYFRNLKRAGAPAPAEDWRFGWPVKLISTLTVSGYFVSAVAKLCGPLGLGWVTGQALRSQMAVDQLRKELLGVAPNAVSYMLYDWLPLFTVLAAGSFVIEFFAPAILLNKRAARIWSVNAWLMHIGIYFVMGITFEYHMTGVIYASFFRLERLSEWVGKIMRTLLGGHTSKHEPALGGAGGTALHRTLDPPATLYYDGDCGLCDRFVQFVLHHDRHENFRFATLQSDAGQAVLARMGFPKLDLKSVVLVEPDGYYERSTATLRVCRRLSGWWPLLYGFVVVPKPLRDWAYSVATRNRKRWFKPPTECPVMPPEWRRRFVSGFGGE